ncbi:protein KRI1 homolog [Gigantopelta aegis]|uniref:protein KRI1 homolog n=1 Tax=Gigantopelta aegis TaxID=1735272 RepID=UPI001B888C01|nr:protein KRI1 homolog [Gigantopelta aegis]
MDDSSDDGSDFKINKAYAKKYNKWRQKEELQKLKDLYGSDEDTDSDSETEDEDATALTAQVEKDWLRAFAAVKTKDPRIYEKDNKFFHSGTSDSNEDEAVLKKKKNKNKTEKPLFLKDYERKLILEKDGIASDESETQLGKQQLSYFEEQDKIKESFKPALESSESSDSDTELLTKKQATEEEKAKQEEDYLEWLKGHRDTLDKNVQLELEPLKSYWDDPNLDDGEKFLKDFILNKRYISNEDNDADFEDFDDGAGFSEEEKELEKEENFERKYNFRYEEPDPEFIKTYPRTVNDSVRTKDNKRSLKRKEIKLRKQEEKNKKREELKQLKNLKKQEILDKIESLKEVTGNPNIGFTDQDLEGDFDPEAYDKMMQKHFGSKYYDEAGEEEKLSFPSDEKLGLDIENWDAWQGVEGEDEKYSENNEGPCVDDPDFVMDADYNPGEDLRPGKKRKHSKFYQALVKKKPVFDPKDKTFEEYFDEYYKLDYEDIIDGLPCRFKYRKSLSNDFGLSVEEVLKCPDRELNSWVSVKKMSQYRSEEEEMRDVKIYQKKAQNLVKKTNILPSLREKSEPKQSTSTDGEPTSKKQKWNKKNKNKYVSDLSVNNPVIAASHEDKMQTVTSNDTLLEFEIKQTKTPQRNTEEMRVKKKQRKKYNITNRDGKMNEETKSQNNNNSLLNLKQTEPLKKAKARKRKREKVVNNSEISEQLVNVECCSKAKELKSETGTNVTSERNAHVETAKDLVEKTDPKTVHKKKKKKKKPKSFEISDERLKAYGINPKKFKYTKSRFLTV